MSSARERQPGFSLDEQQSGRTTFLITRGVAIQPELELTLS